MIRDPEGKDFLSLTGKTDIEGMCEFEFPTSPSAPTGMYMMQLIAGDLLLYSCNVSVETFVPERMSVNISLPESFDPFKSFKLKIKADYLFGAPAAGEEYSGYVRAEETPLQISGYYNYSFGMERFRNERPASWQSELDGGYLDLEGKASEELRIDPATVFNDPIKFTSVVRVTEGGSGRVTSKSLERTLYTKPFYIGIRPGASRVTSGVPLTMSGVILKPDGAPYTGKSHLYYRTYRISYYYSYSYEDDYYEGDYYWNSRVNKIPMTNKKYIDAQDGRFSFTFTPQTSYYDYLVEVVDEVNGTVSQTRIWGWGWWYEEEKVESPEVVQLRLDKKDYDAGEEVKVEALLPFEGNILWCVELDTIYHTEWKEAKGEVASWSFRTPSGVPNVYVSALLVRSGGNYLVQRGLGIQRVRIRPSANKLELTLNAPERIRPGEELVIKIKGRDDFKGTIAVVDEGILQITNFKSPDPYEGIMRDLALTINSAESFGWLIKRFLTRPGGGFAEREKEFPEARFARIVSYWSGLLTSDRDGSIVYRLKIPEYNGKLRVMVVAAGKERFGSQTADVVVKSDVVVSPTIPRFMYTKDRFSFPVTLINTTKKPRGAKILLSLKNCSVEGPREKNVSLKPEEKQVLWFECAAGEEPGGMDITIDGTSETERYHEEFTIPVYPDVPFITASQYVTLKATDKKIDLKPYFAAWYPKAHTARMLLSNIPAISRLNHVRYAIHYPYGCIEQTSTSTLVLLRLASLLPVIAPDITKEKFTEMVNYGIRRIMSMQTISGGFGYWPGSSEPYPWSSGYATFVLMEAKTAGFVVPEGVIKAATNYLDVLSDKSGFNYYVLARGGVLQKKPETVDRLVTMAKREDYTALNLLWIAGAINEAGRTQEARSILGMALAKKPEEGRRYSDDFYSIEQFAGIKLYMIENINPGIEEETKTVLEIARFLAGEKSYYYSTQELAWSLLSLGLYVERLGKESYKAEFKADGKIEKPEREKGLLSWELKNAAKYNSLVLDVESDAELFLCIENTGFSRQVTAFVPYAKGLRIGRSMLSYQGQPVKSVVQGDLVVMKLEIKSESYYDNVALEASLPAGLEVENPRLGRGELPGWAGQEDDLWYPDYVDIRDDRVIIFGRTSYDTRYYYILCRSVTAGEFFLPPVNGLVMYNPEMNAHTAAERFEIRKR